ncbi:MAG: hypothetical protein QM648_11900 [Solirubrobacterales bacterium]
MTRSRVLAPLLILALAATLPTSASAGRAKVFTTTFKGSGSFKSDFNDGSGQNSHA